MINNMNIKLVRIQINWIVVLTMFEVQDYMVVYSFLTQEKIGGLKNLQHCIEK